MENRTFLALGELRRATGGFEAGLFLYGSRYPLRCKGLLVFRPPNTMKLDENEHANTIRLIKVKDIILKEAIAERREVDASERAGVNTP